MIPSRLRVLAALAIGLLVGAGVGFGLASRAPRSEASGTASEAVGIVSARGPGADPASAGPTPRGPAPAPPPGALPPEARTHPEDFADLEGTDEIEEVPPTVQYPILEKLVAEPLSPVRHEVLGAWDEAHESDRPGRRRALVLVVPPVASDAEIESLARDVRARHRDASLLDVRIYDDARAARQSRALDGGRLAYRHLVGQVRRNEALGLDVIRVRGRRIAP